MAVRAGTGSNNLLRVSDLADASSKTVTLTNGSITGWAPAEIDYSVTTGNFTDSGGANDGILLQGSSAYATTFDIQSTLAGSTTEVQGGGGNDTFNVWQTVAGPLNNVAGIAGMLTVDAGGGAFNRLIVDNSGATADQTVTLKNATATGYQAIIGLATAEIDYKTSGAFADTTDNSNDGILLSLAATKAATGSTVNVQTTLAASTTKIIGGSGNDAFNVWQTVTGPLNNVVGIAGMLTIDAGAGADNRLIVDNSGATADQILTLENATAPGYMAIVGLAPAEIDYKTSGAFADPTANNNDGILLELAGVKHLNGSTVNVEATLAGSTTKVIGGNGNDSFKVWQTVAGQHNNVAGSRGMLTIDAGAGADNRLIVDNSGAKADQIVTLENATAPGYMAIIGLAPAEIDYKTSGAFADPTANSNDGILLKVAGTDAVIGSTVNVQTTLAGSTTKVIGSSGNDTFNVWQTVAGPLNNLAGIVGTLTIDAGAGNDNRLIADNSGATADQTVTLNDAADTGYKAITGLAPAEIDYKTSGAFADPTANINAGILLELAATKAVNGSTVDVQTTLGGGSTTKIIGGSGNDTFNVWQTVAGPHNNLAGILGTLTIDAVGGANNRLIVDNSGSSTPLRR